MRTRRRRVIELAIVLPIAWSIMVVTHELGHILGGWLSGASLVRYDIVPWRLPYSLHQPDPVPLITLWMGPIFGVIGPVVLASLIRNRYAWLIADFCILANGTYLTLAWFAGDQLLDTARLINAGAHEISIAAFCAVTVTVGYLRFRKDCINLLRPSDPETH
ncbi:hypothetical protein LOC67_17300 [Stieleria sp. JC731]|uniref:hypothetical protein n=1 Tax=Pirellulaceae TaxID=2691357 RepID=UPI001E3808C3|nr:hypothetical protein [Stieleria sp. JC731]MCC9602314.1 hypothetical protein [Stieleria sp. JC731]